MRDLRSDKPLYEDKASIYIDCDLIGDECDITVNGKAYRAFESDGLGVEKILAYGGNGSPIFLPKERKLNYSVDLGETYFQGVCEEN